MFLCSQQILEVFKEKKREVDLDKIDIKETDTGNLASASYWLVNTIAFQFKDITIFHLQRFEEVLMFRFFFCNCFSMK